MNLRTIVKASLITAMTAGLGVAAIAHGDEEDEKNRFAESKLRHDAMKPMGDGFGRIMKIRKGEGGTPADFPEIAASMAAAASKTKAAFEKDTRGFEGFTKAKDNVWENWEDFAKRLDKMDMDAQAFAEAAKSGDMSKMGPAMGALGKNCKSCHDEYKKK